MRGRIYWESNAQGQGFCESKHASTFINEYHGNRMQVVWKNINKRQWQPFKYASTFSCSGDTQIRNLMSHWRKRRMELSIEILFSDARTSQTQNCRQPQFWLAISGHWRLWEFIGQVGWGTKAQKTHTLMEHAHSSSLFSLMCRGPAASWFFHENISLMKSFRRMILLQWIEPDHLITIDRGILMQAWAWPA